MAITAVNNDIPNPQDPSKAFQGVIEGIEAVRTAPDRRAKLQADIEATRQNAELARQQGLAVPDQAAEARARAGLMGEQAAGLEQERKKPGNDAMSFLSAPDAPAILSKMSPAILGGRTPEEFIAAEKANIASGRPPAPATGFALKSWLADQADAAGLPSERSTLKLSQRELDIKQAAVAADNARTKVTEAAATLDATTRKQVAVMGLLGDALRAGKASSDVAIYNLQKIDEQSAEVKRQLEQKIEDYNKIPHFHPGQDKESEAIRALESKDRQLDIAKARELAKVSSKALDSATLGLIDQIAQSVAGVSILPKPAGGKDGPGAPAPEPGVADALGAIDAPAAPTPPTPEAKGPPRASDTLVTGLATAARDYMGTDQAKKEAAGEALLGIIPQGTSVSAVPALLAVMGVPPDVASMVADAYKAMQGGRGLPPPPPKPNGSYLTEKKTSQGWFKSPAGSLGHAFFGTPEG